MQKQIFILAYTGLIFILVLVLIAFVFWIIPKDVAANTTKTTKQYSKIHICMQDRYCGVGCDKKKGHTYEHSKED